MTGATLSAASRRTMVPATPKKKVSGREALIRVLKKHEGQDMKVAELCEAAQKIAKLPGKTPLATLAAMVYTAAKTKDGFCEKISRGVVRYRDSA
jgi:hypothetical protein